MGEGPWRFITAEGPECAARSAVGEHNAAGCYGLANSAGRWGGVGNAPG